MVQAAEPSVEFPDLLVQALFPEREESQAVGRA
jgi:hypothetical protein